MRIAHQLKDKNVCEYLLYMWQIEDTIRGYACDEERLEKEFLPRLQLEGDALRETTEWYCNLTRMMHEEGVCERGHLQINKGTLSLLTDRHQELLHDPKQPFYSAAYYKALPYIVEIRSQLSEPKPELETCFDILYGVWLLRIQHKDISAETQAAVDTISHLVALLAQNYNTTI